MSYGSSAPSQGSDSCVDATKRLIKNIVAEYYAFATCSHRGIAILKYLDIVGAVFVPGK